METNFSLLYTLARMNVINVEIQHRTGHKFDTTSSYLITSKILMINNIDVKILETDNIRLT